LDTARRPRGGRLGRCRRRETGGGLVVRYATRMGPGRGVEAARRGPPPRLCAFSRETSAEGVWGMRDRRDGGGLRCRLREKGRDGVVPRKQPHVGCITWFGAREGSVGGHAGWNTHLGAERRGCEALALVLAVTRQSSSSRRTVGVRPPRLRGCELAGMCCGEGR
jgi:hypothetical protein